MDLKQYFPNVAWYLISDSLRLIVSPQCSADTAEGWLINCVLLQPLCFQNIVIPLHSIVSMSLLMMSNNVCNLVRWTGLPNVRVDIVTQLSLSFTAFSNVSPQKTRSSANQNAAQLYSWFLTGMEDHNMLKVTKLTEKLPGCSSFNSCQMPFMRTRNALLEIPMLFPPHFLCSKTQCTVLSLDLVKYRLLMNWPGVLN